MHSPHHRQIYLGFVILAFLLATPAIIFYARGERFDRDSNRLVSTGIVSIATEPTTATIRVAGKEISGNTPLQIRAIIPGRYTVEITSPGFQAWKKSILVAAGQTTFLNDVVLLRQPIEATTLVAQGVTAAAISTDGRTLVTATNGSPGVTISRRSLDGVVLQDLAIPTAQRIEQISFSPTGRKLLVQSADQSFVVATDLRSPAVALETLSAGPLSAVEWDAQNENEIFVISPRGVERLDTFDARATLLAAGTFSDLERVGDQIVALESQASGNRVLSYQTSSSAFTPHTPLPAGTWKFLTTTSSRFVVHDRTGAVLVFSRDGQQLVDPAFENFLVTNALAWSPDQERFATIVGNEVWLGSLRQSEHVLVGRFSDPPIAVSFLMNAQTLLLIYPDHIIATDVDGQDPVNFAVIRSAGDPLTVIGPSDEQRNLIILESKTGRLARLALQ